MGQLLLLPVVPVRALGLWATSWLLVGAKIWFAMPSCQEPYRYPPPRFPRKGGIDKVYYSR